MVALLWDPPPVVFDAVFSLQADSPVRGTRCWADSEDYHLIRRLLQRLHSFHCRQLWHSRRVWQLWRLHVKLDGELAVSQRWSLFFSRPFFLTVLFNHLRHCRLKHWAFGTRVKKWVKRGTSCWDDGVDKKTTQNKPLEESLMDVCVWEWELMRRPPGSQETTRVTGDPRPKSLVWFPDEQIQPIKELVLDYRRNSLIRTVIF